MRVPWGIYPIYRFIQMSDVGSGLGNSDAQTGFIALASPP